MATTSSAARPLVSVVRTALGIGGVLAVVLGLLILVWPVRTAEVVTALVAAYALVAGLVYAGLGVFARSMTGWSRVGHIVLGALFVVGGIVAFTNLATATLTLAIFLGVLVGILWIVEGVVALTTLGDRGSRGWTVFFAVVSIIAGLVLFLTPVWGAATLWVLLGVSLVVLGVLQLVRAFRFGRHAVG